MDISRNTMEIATAATTALIGAVVCYGSIQNGISWTDGGPQPGYFPFYVGCLIIFGSLATIFQTVLKVSREHGREDEEPFLDSARLRTLAAFFIPIVVMVAISAWLGLYIGMALYIFYAVRVSAGFRTTTSLLTSAIVVAVNFIIFEVLFTVPLLKGPILESFGIY